MPPGLSLTFAAIFPLMKYTRFILDTTKILVVMLPHRNPMNSPFRKTEFAWGEGRFHTAELLNIINEGQISL